MKQKRLVLIAFCLVIGISEQIQAQVFLKAEYIGSSKFKDENNEETSGKGDAKVVQGGFNIPFYMKMNENNRPTAWGISLGGSYTKMSNTNLGEHILSPEIVNTQLSLSHIRPISNKVSILATLGIGVYTDQTSVSEISFDNVLGSGGVIFVWHLLKNLDLGVGLALNTTFGYPMVFPTFYLNWRLDGRYYVNVSMINAAELTAGVRLHKNFHLNLVCEMNGALALTKIEDKKKMFSHQYIIVGLQPEIKLTKSLSIPLTAGFSAERTAQYQDRSLKAFFKSMGEEYVPHFKPAFYASAAIKYGF